MSRGDLTDEEWSVIGALLRSENGRKSRPAHDNRRFPNGMLYVLRVGCPWRDVHERYGLWNSVYVRFRRWAEQGVQDALLATLVELGLTGGEASDCQFRRVAARYDKTALSFASFLNPATIRKWLPHFVNAAEGLH